VELDRNVYLLFNWNKDELCRTLQVRTPFGVTIMSFQWPREAVMTSGPLRLNLTLTLILTLRPNVVMMVGEGKTGPCRDKAYRARWCAAAGGSSRASGACHIAHCSTARIS
jgi:hypothetical protein